MNSTSFKRNLNAFVFHIAAPKSRDSGMITILNICIVFSLLKALLNTHTHILLQSSQQPCKVGQYYQPFVHIDLPEEILSLWQSQYFKQRPPGVQHNLHVGFLSFHCCNMYLLTVDPFLLTIGQPPRDRKIVLLQAAFMPWPALIDLVLGAWSSCFLRDILLFKW